MKSSDLYLLIILLLGGLGFGIYQWRRWRIRRFRHKPLPPQWLRIIEDNVALYEYLPKDLRRVLHGHIHFFLYHKKFVACDGMDVTEEVRVTIAATACLLVLRRETPIFRGLKSILVYPDTYVVSEQVRDGSVVREEKSTRAGESWFRGPIVLSWADVLRGTLTVDDGFNVVLHEFAHKLDEETGVMNGLPLLQSREHYDAWSSVLSKEYESFLGRVKVGKNKVIDEYGAVSPVEFFAVLSESFFEKPKLMRERLPDLYVQLQRVYDIDPASWNPGCD